MGWQSTQYTVPLAIAAGIAGTMFVMAMTQRGKRGANTLMALFGAMAVYAAAYALQLAATGRGLKLFFHALRYLGPALVTLAFFVFALQFTGRESMITRGSITALAAVPVLTALLIWTDVYSFHDLVLAQTEVVTDQDLNMQVLEVAYGPWYYIHAGYALGLTLAAIGLFTAHWQQTEGAISKRARLFAFSGLVPVAGSLFYVAGWTAIDWGPVTYVITGLILVFAIFSY